MKIFNFKNFGSIILTGAVVLFGAVIQPGMVSFAAELGTATTQQASGQSALWEGTGDEWRVKDGNGGYLKNAWFQDDVTQHWYMLGAGDGTLMYSGLVTDQSTGKTYFMNMEHDGTYGRLISVDGVYNLNGRTVYLTFNQNHDGHFGAITSGLSEARQTGVKETQFSQIPTGNSEVTQESQSQQKPQQLPPRSTSQRRAAEKGQNIDTANLPGKGDGTVHGEEFCEGWWHKPVSEMTDYEQAKLIEDFLGGTVAVDVTIDTKGGTIDDSFLRGQ